MNDYHFVNTMFSLSLSLSQRYALLELFFLCRTILKSWKTKLLRSPAWPDTTGVDFRAVANLVFLAALASCRERLRKRWRQRWKNKDKYRGSRDARLSYLGQMDDETKNTSDRERIKFVVKSERSFFPFRIE